MFHIKKRISEATGFPTSLDSLHANNSTTENSARVCWMCSSYTHFEGLDFPDIFIIPPPHKTLYFSGMFVKAESRMNV